MTVLPGLSLGRRGAPGPAWPDYDPRAVTVGIVHLGLGNFHRAHQAAYTDRVLARDPSWGICGVSLRSRGVIDTLATQDHLYTVLERGPAGDAARVIGSVRASLAAADGVEAVLARIAAPDTRIVSLTVTEKGYCHRPADGSLDTTHPDIVHDLAHAQAPVSTPGILVRGLALRRTHGTPLTVLSCDNLPHNGATVRGIVLDFARRIDEGLAAWIEANVAFPSTMVDRIVPAVTEADFAAVRAFGHDDRAPVATEPFTQWVIEDRFAAGRPAWEAAGAQFVADVAPFELMKLRLLNGAHSTMAYLGYLAGHEFIYQASADPDLARAVERLWAELEPTLPGALAASGVDVAAYRRDLMARFRNTALPHRTWQIAMDGSQKLPQRLLAAARERLARDLPVDAIALTVAAWMRYVAGRDERGATIDVRDPLAADFARVAAAAQGSPSALADGLLALDTVFGRDLPADARFAGPVRRHLSDLMAHGVRAVLAAR
jgi:fructuronate reductase